MTFEKAFKIVLVIFLTITVTSGLLYLFTFPELSDEPSDWGVYFTFYSGFFSTLFSSVTLYFLIMTNQDIRNKDRYIQAKEYLELLLSERKSHFDVLVKSNEIEQLALSIAMNLYKNNIDNNRMLVLHKYVYSLYEIAAIYQQEKDYKYLNKLAVHDIYGNKNELEFINLICTYIDEIVDKTDGKSYGSEGEIDLKILRKFIISLGSRNLAYVR